jgi:hypothetical protein
MCYHLDYAKKKSNSNAEVIRFSDSEYYDFITSLVNDNYLVIRNETGDLS